MGSGQGGHHLVPHLLFLFERANKISYLCRLGWRQHKDSELRGYALVGEGKLIGDVDNIASYAVLYDSANVLGGRLSSTSVVKGVCFVG